jgi:hypothetical protein
MIELACPEECVYLHEARAQGGEREAKLRAEDETFARAGQGITERTVPILLMIERGIIDAHRGVTGGALRDLKDVEIREAMENAVKNLQTEESGLIYEHHAPSPRIDEVSRRIRAALDEFSQQVPAETRPRRSDILKMLNVTRAAVDLHIRRGEDDRSYLRHISLYFPWPEEKTRPLII